MRDPSPDPGFSCPRCESQSYKILFQDSDRLYRTTKKVFSVIECSGCALIRLFPRPTPAELASFYPREYWWKADPSALGSLTELYRRFVLWDHVRFIAASPIPPGPILDVGSGGGALVEELRRRGLPVAGLDPSPRAAGMTGSGGAPAVCAALPDAPFAAASFAAVTLLHVLEHVADPVECLLAARRLLQPGGRLFVQVPNAAGWQFLLLGRRWSALDVPRHLFHFRAEDLEDVLAGCGFRVVRRKFFSLRDNPASAATSLCAGLEPLVRRVRGVREPALVGALKSFLYFGLVALSLPFALWEAAAMAGSTILVEAALVEDE